ncbi:MAG: AAA family ATPase [Richelia sp. RM2_1_2]|nr:AAA family ATPase [Richelia sp. RM2_1_2]
MSTSNHRPKHPRMSMNRLKRFAKRWGVKFIVKNKNNYIKQLQKMSESKKDNLEELYFYFFDGDVGLNVKNIISYNNDTINIDSFNITIEGLPKSKVYEFLAEKGLRRLSKHENLNNKHNKEAALMDYMFDDSNDYYHSDNFEVIINISNAKKKSYDISCTHVVGFEPIADIRKYLEEYCRKFDNRIQIITKKQHGYDIEAIDVKKISIDFEKYYNDDFDLKHLEENILSEENGIIMLSGVPGSGKSSLIKYLVRHLDKQFCYLPANNIEIFSDPGAIPFIIQELNNKVLVIEDCEKLLKSRTENGNNEVATILNISDGILGDYLNLKMIVTLNVTENIDDALLRKGRLLYSYDFKKLSVVKANELAKELKIEEKFTEETALTDILNFNKNTGIEKFKPKKKVIGFGSK